MARFEQHVWEKHGLRLEHLFQVIEDSPRLYARGKQYLVVGRNLGGSVLTIPLRVSNESKGWRPVTMYESDSAVTTKYENQED